MPRLFAFLRAINVGGHTVTMSRLTQVFTGLGLDDVQPFLASGNVAFRSRAAGGARLEGRIAEALEAALGFEVATFLRTEEELAAIIRHRPFGAAELEDGAPLLIGLVGTPPSREGMEAIGKLRSAVDDVRVRGREIYWLRHPRQGSSILTGANFERALGVPATFRNVNTFTRLATRHGIPTS